jgi:hypothetical protein
MLLSENTSSPISGENDGFMGRLEPTDRHRERREAAPCSRWLTAWRMGENAPYLPLAIPSGSAQLGRFLPFPDLPGP